MLRAMVHAFHHTGINIGLGKVRYRVAARLEEQNGLLAIGYPDTAETHAHASAQWFNEQQSGRQWIRR
jgi:hypothetical protein